MKRIIHQGSIDQGVHECEAREEWKERESEHGAQHRSVASCGIVPLLGLFLAQHVTDARGDGRAVLFEHGEGALHVLIDRLL